ncbi:MAG: hypothetical protein NZ750_08300 [Anaerolineae bacterium]|nr:hypothetical protein [Anaerolineae bacterium]MDW8172350.1 hypothetical protein [Anaerolineae bacterium]
MKHTLYTQKSIKECLSLIQERLEEKETKSRPALGGWTEKDGRFCLSLASLVLGFPRTTQLIASLAREGGVTVIEIGVNEGLDPKRARIVIYAFCAIALLIFLNGAGLLALLSLVLAFMAYVWLVGDHRNSAALLKEVKRLLNAKDRPIFDSAAKSVPKSTSGAAKPVPKSASSAAKPAPRK